ncbi:MAG: hypothetical protein JWO67_1334 [Streptosporangiaceae bacterium]|jgi:uncharacterized protein (TIGR03083 family)|nr:hypothetical protein [Streptosporangiaceae bacterium]
MTAQPDIQWDHDRFCTATEAEIARFVGLVEEADPATPVPTCPGWTVAALAEHHGATHRWVQHILSSGARERVSARDLDLRLPGDEAGYAAWVADGARRLVATMRRTDPRALLWTWAGDRHVDWWSRRMLHEALVHRADAEIALGRTPHLDAVLAVDGIEEFLSNVAQARRVTDRMPSVGADGETVHLHATDVPGEWTVTLHPDGFTWEPGHAKGTVGVRAGASDLLLLVYGRASRAEARFEVFGDGDLLDRWLRAAAF